MEQQAQDIAYESRVDFLRQDFELAMTDPSASTFISLNDRITLAISDLMIDKIDSLSDAFSALADGWIEELRVLQLHVQAQIRLTNEPQNVEELKHVTTQKAVCYLLGADQNMDDVLLNLDQVVSLNSAVTMELQNDLVRLDLVRQSEEDLLQESRVVRQQLRDLLRRFIEKRRNAVILLILLFVILGLSIWHLVWTLQSE